MAANFSVGVSQSCRSTPAVLLPEFSITRLTARARALNEWVSQRCKAFTLRHWPACVAFAKRCCMTFTFLCTRCQSMLIQSSGAREVAEPVFLGLITFMLILCEARRTHVTPKGWCVPSGVWFERPRSFNGLTTNEPDGSLHTFVVGQILNPYPDHYSRAFAFSILPYPLRHGLPLRVALPHVERRVGLTTFPTTPH